MAFDAGKAARHIVAQHANRRPYENLTGALEPPGIADAYSVQEALSGLWAAERGPVAGLKIATTTKVMQQLMGIDHPCGGLIFERTIQLSPMRLDRARFQHVVVECELAVRLQSDLPARGRQLTREDVRAAVGSVMCAFELIEDRYADYKATSVKTLIADNAWNAGIVLGAVAAPAMIGDFNRCAGRLVINDKLAREGLTDDPLGALAWVANLAIERGRPLRAGMVVITGSVIPTLPIAAGDRFSFSIGDLPPVEMAAV